MRLYIIRHADPDYPGNTITDHGRRESEALAERLASQGLTRIYSSPVNRALHTMEYTERLTGLAPVVLPWTEELRDLWVPDPERTRLPAWDVPAERLRATEQDTSHDLFHRYPEYDGLPVRRTIERIRRHSDYFLADLGFRREDHRYRILRENRERVAVFCHGGFGLTWIGMLLYIPLHMVWAGFWLAPSSVTTILFDERSAAYAVPRALAVGDTSHLHAHGLEPRPRGLLGNVD
jgi:probable phosphoglycerate mutase